jgi:hypothetical protein
MADSIDVLTHEEDDLIQDDLRNFVIGGDSGSRISSTFRAALANGYDRQESEVRLPRVASETGQMQIWT